MAIYHMSAQVISRSAGRSATAAAAYRAGEKIVDERTGQVNDYTRKQGVDYQEILTPTHVGEWAKDRATLWNAAEQSENRKNSQVAREINIAIPIELSPEQGRELVRGYAQKNFVNQGMIADICIHGEDTNNPHAHIMLSMREAGQEGFTNKNRDWNAKEQLEKWREDWAHSCNYALDRAGELARVDHRSLSAQGVGRAPTVHQGPSATEIERKRGESWVCGINTDIQQLNDINKEIQDIQNSIENLTKELELIKKEEQVFTPEIETVPEQKPQDELAMYNLSLKSTWQDARQAFEFRMSSTSQQWRDENKTIENARQIVGAVGKNEKQFEAFADYQLSQIMNLRKEAVSLQEQRDKLFNERENLKGFFNGSKKKELSAKIDDLTKKYADKANAYNAAYREKGELIKSGLEVSSKHNRAFEQSPEHNLYYKEIFPAQSKEKVAEDERKKQAVIERLQSGNTKENRLSLDDRIRQYREEKNMTHEEKEKHRKSVLEKLQKDRKGRGDFER